MRLTFLSAAQRLTKSFTRSPTGAIEKSAYPHSFNFTSVTQSVTTPTEFASALRVHADAGHCLLKGIIQREISDESRAGTTSQMTPTAFSCFDLDNIEGVASIEDFVQRVLPAAFQDVDYIAQWSASAGVTDETGVRAHVFFLHSREFVPEQAKSFVTELNLTNALLASQLQLTATGLALRYRLDRTVNQNDKLIYIAPPTLGEGVADRLSGERIVHVKKTRPYVDFDWTTQATKTQLDSLTERRVAELRRAADLPDKNVHTKRYGDESILTNPDVAIVTGERTTDESPWTYLNLNGGDSWAYYYVKTHPKLLRNFKGEPIVELATIVPEYAADLSARTPHATRTLEPHMLALVFRVPDTDLLWHALYDRKREQIDMLARISRPSVPDFFTQYGRAVPETIEDWRLEFDPTTLVQLDTAAHFCNRWKPSPYMGLSARDVPIPPVCSKIIHHVLAADPECVEHFLNWLAWIFQTRGKSMTAWFLQGVQGTGKGLLFYHILSPLFGVAYCGKSQQARLDDNFNAEFETRLIHCFDEVSFSEVKERYTKLKEFITESTISIRDMRTTAVERRNFTNFLFYSNEPGALEIEETDRRFNVAPRQEARLIISEEEVASIEGELAQLASHLLARQVDSARAHRALENEAKRIVREDSADWIDGFLLRPLMRGDLEHFMSYAAEHAGSQTELLSRHAYVRILARWAANVGRPSDVYTSELRTVYEYLGRGQPVAGPAKFGKLLARRNVRNAVVRVPGGEPTRAVPDIVWHAPDEITLARWRKSLEQVGSPMSGGASIQAHE